MGQDQSWFEHDTGFAASYFLDSAGVVNKGITGRILQLLKLLWLSLKLYSVFRRHGVTKVFSVGGYSASPAVFAAILFRKPLYIHEQNASMGSLNKISKPFAKAFFSSFHPASPCPNYPVEHKFFDSRRIRTSTNVILFMGGSLGARSINDLAIAAAAELLASGKTIIHLTGTQDYERIRQFYETNCLSVTCIAFDRNIDHLIAQADFAVSRAGASSLFELYANALPTLFVPYPHAASDHQYHNAMYLVKQDMAYCKREEELTKELLLELIEIDHTSLSEKMHSAFHPDGAACIVSHLRK